MSTLAPLPAPTVVGSYELQQVVGSGAWGRVYRAAHRFQPGWTAAAKELIGGPAVLDRFAAEANLLMQLSHPNLPRVYDYLVHDAGDGPRPFIVMEWVEGGTLTTALQSRRLPEDELRWIADELLVTLEYLHGRAPAVLHRDIKSDNIMLRWGQPRQLTLLNLGIACLHDQTGRRRGTIAGTQHYGSPQQLQGLPPEPSDDLFGVAATLYEAALGGRQLPPFPFLPTSEAEVVTTLRGTALSAELQGIIAGGLRYNRAARWQSAPAMRAALTTPGTAQPAAPAAAPATRGGWNPLRTH